MQIKTICEAAVVVLLIAGMFLEDDLIKFEEILHCIFIAIMDGLCEIPGNLRRRKKEFASSFRAYKRDVKAIYRACKRQGITFRLFMAMLLAEFQNSVAIELGHEE